MGCNCGGGSRADRSGSTRRMLTKAPGYTWDGPPSDEDEQADEQPTGEQPSPDPAPAV